MMISMILEDNIIKAVSLTRDMSNQEFNVYEASIDRILIYAALITLKLLKLHRDLIEFSV